MPHPTKPSVQTPEASAPQAVTKVRPQGNLEIREVDGKIHLIIDPTVDLGASETGKTRIVAKMTGTTPLARGCFLTSITVWKR